VLVCVCVCVYAELRVCVCLCPRNATKRFAASVYVCLCLNKRVCACVQCGRVYARCAGVCVRERVCTHIRTHKTHTCTHIHTHIFARTHTRTHTPRTTVYVRIMPHFAVSTGCDVCFLLSCRQAAKRNPSRPPPFSNFFSTVVLLPSQVACNVDLSLIKKGGKPHCYLVAANPSL